MENRKRPYEVCFLRFLKKKTSKVFASFTRPWSVWWAIVLISIHLDLQFYVWYSGNRTNENDII